MKKEKKKKLKKGEIKESGKSEKREGAQRKKRADLIKQDTRAQVNTY